MDEYISWMEKNPKWLKIILCLGPLDWSWAIWRILKGVKKNSALEVLLGIVWILLGWGILWILDIVCILINDYPFWFK